MCVCDARVCLRCTYTHQIHEHMNSSQAIKDIAPGQELLVQYGTEQWFERKNIQYTNFDYANTMWRPDLQSLPCRENVDLTFGADGRPSFAVKDNLPAGAVMDISPCVKVSLIVVDQFLLWDFVLIYSEASTVYMYEDAEVC